MNYTEQDRAIALIGIYQAAQQVFDLATTGKTDESAYHTSLESLFIQNPADTLAVFGGDVQNIQWGVNTLLAQMSSDIAVSNRNIEITKYVLSLMILEKNIQQADGVFNQISKVIDSAQAQRAHFGEFHENVIATLARAYSENVSNINPRIMVNGQHGHLQNPRIANKIRALLLAGIRAVVLWRQVGGTRWGLIWNRKKYLRAAQALYRTPNSDNHSEPTSLFKKD